MVPPSPCLWLFLGKPICIIRVSTKQTFGCFLQETLESPKLAVWAEYSAGYSNQSKEKPPQGLLEHLGWGKWSRNLCRKAIYICLTLVKQVPRLFPTQRHLDAKAAAAVLILLMGKEWGRATRVTTRHSHATGRVVPPALQAGRDSRRLQAGLGAASWLTVPGGAHESERYLQHPPPDSTLPPSLPLQAAPPCSSPPTQIP